MYAYFLTPIPPYILCGREKIGNQGVKAVSRSANKIMRKNNRREPIRCRTNNLKVFYNFAKTIKFFPLLKNWAGFLTLKTLILSKTEPILSVFTHCGIGIPPKRYFYWITLSKAKGSYQKVVIRQSSQTGSASFFNICRTG